jgi:hypothetical protein
MAFNFKPLQYSPFAHQRATAPQYDQYMTAYDMGGGKYSPNLNQWNQEQNQAQQGAFQGYAGNQFQSLFDSVNDLGASPMVSGSAYNNTPQYSPYQGTREQFTTGTQPAYYNDYADDGTWIDPDGPTAYNQQGYLDARFGNINDYLSKIGSFFGNMGNGQDAQTQALLANMQGQGARPVMPSVGMGSTFNPSAGGTGTHGNNPFQSFGALQSGGWGTAPTSLFGGGSGLNPNTSPSIHTPSSYPTPQRATMRASTEGNQNSGANAIFNKFFGENFSSMVND